MKSRIPNILGRWRPSGARPARAVVAVAFNLGCAAGAIALFAYLDPRAEWGQPVLLVALGVIAAVAFAAELRLKSGVAAYFDSSIVLALIALAVAGPLPALCVWAVPDAISRLVVRQDPIFSPGMVATLSGFALALLAGEAVLTLADPSSLVAGAPALYTAGLVVWAVDFAVSGILFAPFYQGYRLRPLVRSEFFELAPVVMAMLAVAVGAAALVPALGMLALALVASVILLPQLGFAALARSSSVARLGRGEATALYASALADQLRLSGFERRLVDSAATRLRHWAGETPVPSSRHRVAEPALTGVVALGVDERWDGSGGPFAIPAARTLRASRVLALAGAWSSLTAAGTAQLPHDQALLALAMRAEQFDPEVLDAAAEIVAAEGAMTRSGDFQPRLHRLPLPHAVRQRGIPGLAAHFAAQS